MFNKIFRSSSNTEKYVTANEISQLRKEFQDLYKETLSQNSKNNKLALEIEKKVDIAESKVTEQAIDKTFNVLAQVRNWIVIILIIISLSGIIGYQSFRSSLESYFKERVEDWLRFDNSESDGKQALDKLRTQALLDAYTIRLARSFSQPYGIDSNQLSPTEVNRLLEIVIDPATDYGSFADALRLISMSRGIFVLLRPEDEVGKQIVSILENNKYSPLKKGLVLDYFSKEEVLLPYAIAILEDTSLSENVRISALENVVHFEPDFYLNYIKNNFDTFESLYAKSHLASILAEEEPVPSLTYDYLKKLKESRPEYWQGHYLQPLSSLISNSDARFTSKLQVLTAEMISQGLSTELTDSRMGPRYLALSLSTASSPLKNLNNIFSDDKFVSAVVSLLADEITTFKQAIDFFQIDDAGASLTTVLFSPSSNFETRLQDGEIITRHDINGLMWIKFVDAVEGSNIEVTWRDPLGTIQKGKLVSAKGMKDGTYSISVDSDVIKNVSIREHNRGFYRWL